MKKYLIRFNVNRGQPGRGSVAHVWRVFEIFGDEENEYIFKNVQINVPSYGAEGPEGHWNICCNGVLTIDKKTSTAIINEI